MDRRWRMKRYAKPHRPYDPFVYIKCVCGAAIVKTSGALYNGQPVYGPKCTPEEQPA